MNSLSLNEISYNILNSIRGGRVSNAEKFSIEQIHFLVKYYRSLLIRRDQERNMNRSRMFEQDLGIVPLEVVDSSDTSNTGNILLRTESKIPTPIRLKSKEAITHISGKDKYSQPIPLIDTVRAHWMQYNSYTGDNIFAFYRDGYVFLYNTLSIRELNIRGIFEDPQQVFDFANEDGEQIYDDNSPYPIPADMVEQITKAILSTEAGLVAQTQPQSETNFEPDKR